MEQHFLFKRVLVLAHSLPNSDIPVRVTATICAWCYGGRGIGCLFQLAKSLSSHWDTAEGLKLAEISAAESRPTSCQKDAGEISGETNTIRKLDN